MSAEASTAASAHQYQPGMIGSASTAPKAASVHSAICSRMPKEPA